MGKRRRRSGKEGELANFPEEQTLTLLSPRYLAVATSLILVSSAFASLILKDDVTGFATSTTMQRWRDQGIVDDWESGGMQSRTATNVRNDQGQIIIPNNYVCPEEALLPAAPYRSTANKQGCYNVATQANQVLAMCDYQNARGSISRTRCTSQ